MQEEIDKITFRRSDRLGTGKFGWVFCGKYEHVVTVAIKRMEKQLTKLDSRLYNIANGHPNIIHYFYSNEDDDIEYL